jgi:hypothetical protein
VKVGRGVFVGTGVGVGIRTRSLPNEHPRLPTTIIISNILESDLRFINRLSIPLSVISSLLSSPRNSYPDTLRRRGDSPTVVKGKTLTDYVAVALFAFEQDMVPNPLAGVTVVG